MANDLAAAAAHLPPTITIAEAAFFARVSGRTVRRWIASGRLQCGRTHPGRRCRVVIPRTALVGLLAGEVAR